MSLLIARPGTVWTSHGSRAGRVALCLCALLAALVSRGFVGVVVINGTSMAPSLTSGQPAIVAKGPLTGPIERGDVVLIRDATGLGHIVKRVRWLQGEVVDMRSAPFEHPIKSGAFVVPYGYVYVLGDNADASEDSRSFGPVPIDRIAGKLLTP